MKKIIRILVLTMAITVTALSSKVAADYDPFEGQIVFNQMVVSMVYEDEELIGKVETNLPAEQFGPWQILMSPTENSEWVAHEDKLLTHLMDGGNVFRESPYTYYGYYILYSDGAKEIGYERIITYDMLHQKEVEKGKRIQYVQAYFGETSKITINYNLISADGKSSLLKSEESYGKYDLKHHDDIYVTGEKAKLNTAYTDKYVNLSPDIESEYAYTKDDRVININFRIPKYTVNYVDEEGTKLEESKIFNVDMDEIFEHHAPEINGYEILEGGIIKIPYTNIDKEFNVIYRKNFALPTNTVNFVDESGNKLKNGIVIPAVFGERFKYNAPEIEGYSIKTNQYIDEAYSKKNREYTIVYSKNSDETVDPTEPTKPGVTDKSDTLPKTGVDNLLGYVYGTLITFGVVCILMEKKIVKK